MSSLALGCNCCSIYTPYLPEVDLRGYPVDAVVTEYDGLGELEVSSPGRGVEVVMVLVMAVPVTPELAQELELDPAQHLSSISWILMPHTLGSPPSSQADTPSTAKPLLSVTCKYQ